MQSSEEGEKSMSEVDTFENVQPRSPKVSEFEQHDKDTERVEAARFKIERYLFYIVLAIAGTGLIVAAANTSIFQTVISWFSPSGGHDPNIIHLQVLGGNNLSRNASPSYPAFNNSYVRFNISFNDTDPNDWHSMVVCNGSASNYTFDPSGLNFNFTCGWHVKLCAYSSSFVTDNPLFCDHVVAGYENQTQNFTVYLIDSGAKVSNRSGIFAVDRPPFITNIEVDVV